MICYPPPPIPAFIKQESKILKGEAQQIRQTDIVGMSQNYISTGLFGPNCRKAVTQVYDDISNKFFNLIEKGRGMGHWAVNYNSP